MAYEKSWQFDTNRAVEATTSTDMGQYILWYYKALLCGQIGGATTGLWTVIGSSDAVTAGMDGVDRWGPTFNASKIVRGFGAAVRSWIVLRSPTHPLRGTNIYLMLSWDTAIDYNITLQISSAAPTGGTTVARPTFAIPVAATSPIVFFNTTNFGNFHLNGALATDGSFYMLTSRDNTGVFSSAFLGCWLGNAKPTDQFPFFMSLAQSNLGWGTGATVDIQSASFACMIPPDGLAQGSYGWAAIVPSSVNLPTGSDPWDSTYVDMPIFVGSATLALRGVRGRLQDIAYFPGGANAGTVDSTSGAPTYMIAGNYWFPTNAAPSL